MYPGRGAGPYDVEGSLRDRIRTAHVIVESTLICELRQGPSQLAQANEKSNPRVTSRRSPCGALKYACCILACLVTLPSCAVADFYGDPLPAYQARTAYQLADTGVLLILSYGCAHSNPMTRLEVRREGPAPSTVTWAASGSAFLEGRVRIRYGTPPKGLESEVLLELKPDVPFVVDMRPASDYALSGKMKLSMLPTQESGDVLGVDNDVISIVDFWRNAEARCG